MKPTDLEEIIEYQKKQIEELESSNRLLLLKVRTEQYTCSICGTSEDKEWAYLRNERDVLEGKLERITDEVNNLRPWVEELTIKELNLEQRIANLRAALELIINGLSEKGPRVIADDALKKDE